MTVVEELRKLRVYGVGQAGAADLLSEIVFRRRLVNLICIMKLMLWNAFVVNENVLGDSNLALGLIACGTMAIGIILQSILFNSPRYMADVSDRIQARTAFVSAAFMLVPFAFISVVGLSGWHLLFGLAFVANVPWLFSKTGRRNILSSRFVSDKADWKEMFSRVNY